MFDGKSILITGGTGTFGQAMVKYLITNFNPAKVVVFSRDEAKQHDMQLNLSHDSLRFFLGDVRDVERLNLAFRGIDFVIHAAALKHVPAAEYNPMECIKTNVIGAGNVIEAALQTQVKRIIALSTDKAANPINLYGATKLAADKLFIAANNLVGRNETRFSIVRYGNVLNSRGSLIPTFRQLLSSGSKFLPITDAKMTRFWVPLELGIQFVADSFKRMKGGEIFVPKIGSSRVSDLVEALAPGIEQRIVGIRPGEKLHEVLCPQDNYPQTIEFDDFFLIAPSIIMHDGDTYTSTAVGEIGRPVSEGFEYSSNSNSKMLSIKELRSLLEKYC